MGQGAAGKMAVDSVEPFDTSSICHEFQSESLQKVGTHVDTTGIRGTRSRIGERVRAGGYRITGSIVMQPTPDEIDWWLPRILGGNESTNSFPLAETLPTFQIMIDRVQARHIYQECKVSRATFSASQGQPLVMTLDIEGLTEDVTSNAFPAIEPANDVPYMFFDGAFTLLSGVKTPQSFTLTIDNLLDTERFLNSQSRVSLPEQDRNITLALTVPYDSTHAAMYDAALGSATGGSLVFTNSTRSCTMTLAKIQWPPESPTITGRSEIFLTLNSVIRTASTTKEIVITNDNTV